MPDITPVAPTAPPVSGSTVVPGSTPKDGAGNHPVQQTAPVVPEKPKEPTAEERLAEIDKATRRAAYEGMKRAQEAKKHREQLETERQSLAKEKEELASWKQEQADRKRNPLKYLNRDFGDNWFDTINRLKLEGGGTTVDLVASEVDDRVKSIRKELEDYKATSEQKEKERATQQAQQWRENFDAGAVRYLDEQKAKYPLIHAVKTQSRLPSLIEDHFNQTARLDEDGNQVPGEVLTYEQAAQRMENELDGVWQAMQKAKVPVAPEKEKPVTPDRPRRSLTTDLTATQTGTPTPPRNERERFQRALAKFEEVAQARRS